MFPQHNMIAVAGAPPDLDTYWGGGVLLAFRAILLYSKQQFFSDDCANSYDLSARKRLPVFDLLRIDRLGLAPAEGQDNYRLVVF